MFVLDCSHSLLEMDTVDLDFVQLSQLIGRKTGGISVYPSTSAVRGRAEPSSHIIVKGKAMASQTSDLFGLVSCWLPKLMFLLFFCEHVRHGFDNCSTLCVKGCLIKSVKVLLRLKLNVTYIDCRCERSYRTSSSPIKAASNSLSCRASLGWRY